MATKKVEVDETNDDIDTNKNIEETRASFRYRLNLEVLVDAYALAAELYGCLVVLNDLGSSYLEEEISYVKDAQQGLLTAISRMICVID